MFSGHRVASFSLLMFAAAVAVADDTNALAAFARANADKYRNEIDGGPIKLGDKVTVRGRFDRIDMVSLLPEYNPDGGVIQFTSSHHINTLKLGDQCKAGSSFVGQNAFGTKLKVQRRTCERLFASDSDVMGPPIAYVSVAMSPTQYREIKRAGVAAEFDFAIGEGDKPVPIEFSENLDRAEIDYPFETTMRVWTVFGRIDAIRWVLPGATQPTLVWRRER